MCSVLLHNKVNQKFNLKKSITKFNVSSGSEIIKAFWVYEYYWNEAKCSFPSNERCAINTCTNTINSDSSEGKFVHISNSLI